MAARVLLRRTFRDPLVHFAVLGAGIFALHAAVAPPPRDGRIVITADFLAGLRQEHAARAGRPPTPEEERALVDRFVDEEMLYREAVALGLDRGDPIVRRRLAQKMTFVAEDGAGSPTDDELAAWLAAHEGRYREPPRLSFRHVYVARGRDGGDAEAEARRLLAELASGAAPDTLGDPFLQGRSFAARTPAEIEAVFGHAFAEALAAAPEGVWAGPFASSYGAHLVRIEGRAAGATPPLAAVRERVRADLRDERRAAALRAMREKLRARYAVEIEAGAAGGAR